MREPIVWLNGRLLPSSEARISPFDRGFTVGCAAFETLCAHDGKIFATTRHWNRLVRSCQIISVQPPVWNEFISIMDATVKANQLREARVRITVTAGDGDPAPGGTASPTVLVHAVPLQKYPAIETVVTSPWPRNERSALAGIKCSSYAENIRALAHAHAQRAGETIFANTRDELCEGATTNVFLVRDGKVLTPPVSSGCLPGVTRDIVIELCREQGVPFSEENIPMSALTESDEIFLTSSTRGVQPVSRVDEWIAPSSPGPMTLRVARMYEELAAKNDDP